MTYRRYVRELTVDVVRSRHGVWELSVAGEPDVHGHTHLLSKLDRAIDKMIQSEMKLRPGEYIVSKNLRLTPELRDALSSARVARDRLEDLQSEAALRTRRAVVVFRRAGYSYRDIAQLLGITHQRVHQLLQEMGESGVAGDDETSEVTA